MRHLEKPQIAPAICRVFTAFEPSYWRGLVCTAWSLLRRSTTPVRFDVLTRPETLPLLDRLATRIAERVPEFCTINPVVVPSAVIRQCERLTYAAHFKPEICFRLFYHEIVSIDGDALYTDIDTIHLHDIGKLRCNVGESHPLMARPDSAPDYFPQFCRNGVGYFNSGVLLFNYSKFAAEIDRGLALARSSLSEFDRRFTYLDQDALNIGFDAQWGDLPMAYNYMTKDPGVHPADHCIVHASGSRKPWALGGGHRFARLYAREMGEFGIPWHRKYSVDWMLHAAVRKVSTLRNNWK